ncbi:MAG: rod shape-determining protein RodA [Candidatus Pacebacteria bacterium]|nr:rod shape-determining protein RodA [Candidatus Paceibacterota bacterium]
MYQKNFSIDWILVVALVPIVIAGLVTMSSFTGETSFFWRQFIWVIVSFAVMFGVSRIDIRFLKQTSVLMSLYGISVMLLALLFFVADPVKGSIRWIDLGFFSFQPSDPAKIVLILVLAKYFSRRHIEIAQIRHIIVSASYMMIMMLLIFFQPDFKSSLVFMVIWLGMVLVAGISKKHLLLVGSLVIVAFGMLWLFAFQPYQKQRIMTFINPLSDIQGSGYNAYQSTIAVGSGQLLGKGVGYGSQSRLQFLPESETDFIFASFAEEWGFIGSFLLIVCYGILIWRIFANALMGSSNFETLYGVGIGIYFSIHTLFNIGMNIGLLPVTGIPLPFMSYGGSNMLTSFLALGILLAMRRYARPSRQEDVTKDILELT